MAFVLDVSNDLVDRCWILSTGTGYATITGALAVAVAGDTILLSEGYWNESVTLTQNELTLVGAGIGKSVIDGNVSFGEYSLCQMRNFSVYNGTLGVNSDDAIVDLVEVHGNGNNGFSISHKTGLDSTNILLRNIVAKDCTSGIQFTATTYNINDVTIDGYTAFQCGEGIASNFSGGSNINILMRNILIQDCFNNSGVRITTGRWEIYNSIIKDCVNGVEVDAVANVDLTILDSILTGSATNLKLDENAFTLTHHIRNNKIHDGSSYDVDSVSGTSADVEYNWWGTASPAAGQFNGTVDYTPYLTMPSTSIYNSELLQSGVSAASVWGYAQRRLTDEVLDSGNLAKQTDVSGLNNLTIADVTSGCDTSVAKVATNTTNKLTDARALALDSIATVLTDTNEIQGKLPTNYLMGSSDVNDHDTDIDSILVDTGTTIPTTLSSIEGKVDTVDTVVDTILVDTNEMQGKLPTNYIMGSSDQTDKDDDIDAILVDTGTTLPATLTTMEGKIDIVDTVVDSVLVDTGTTIPAQLVTMESDIRGSDSDDLKTISDQIDTISSEARAYISVPEPIIIPYGQTTLDGAILAAATTLTVDDDSVFEDDGYITVDSGGDIEYMHYSGKSSNVLTIDAKALFGSSDVGHADAVAVKQMIPHRTKLTIHDAGVPKAPDSAPNIAIDDMEGNAILAATAMTQEGVAVGIYYYDMLITAGTTPDVRELQYTVIVDTNTNEYRKIVGLINKPSTTGEVFNSNLSSLRYCNQDGYLNGSGTFVAWTDDEVGYLRDSSGNRILNGEVRWFLKVDEVTEYAVNPPGFTRTDVNGNWNLMMPTGTFTVQFWSTGTETVSVERTVA